MRWVLLALCGCNQVFGLSAPVERDAPFVVPPDAQPLCPQIGTVPAFSPNIFQLFDADCSNYTLSTPAHRAMAKCMVKVSEVNSIEVISDGPAEGPLVVHPELPDSNAHMIDARLDADGAIAYVTVFDPPTGNRVYETWQRTDAGYVRGPDLGITGVGLASTPSRTTPRHLLFIDNASNMLEWVETAPNAWQSHPIPNTIATFTPFNVWFAADGLRAVLFGSDSSASGSVLIYIDRARIDDAFSTAVPLPSLPPVPDLFITEDCTRAYMSSVQSIFYVAQI